MATKRSASVNLEEKAQEVANKHSKALLLYANCHQKMNSNKQFTDEEVKDLGKNNILHSLYS